MHEYGSELDMLDPIPSIDIGMGSEPVVPGEEVNDRELQVESKASRVRWDTYKEPDSKKEYDSAAALFLGQAAEAEGSLVRGCIYPCAPNASHDTGHYACIKAGCHERATRPGHIMQHMWEAHPDLRQSQVKFYAGWTEGQQLVFKPNSNRIHKPHAKSRQTVHKPVAPETRAKRAAVKKAVKAAENKAAKQFSKVELRTQEHAAAQQKKLEAAEAAQKAAQDQLSQAYNNITELVRSNNTLAQSNQTMAEAAKLQAENTSKALNSAIQLNVPGRLGEAGKVAAQQIE